MSTASVRRRVTRRELHSPRSTAAIVVAVLLVLALAWVGTEIVIALLGLPALLVAPADMFASAVNLPEAPAGIVVAAGAVAVVLGLVLIVLGLAPGRRPRHVLETERAATVVDNEVVASALARHASLAADVDPDHTTVSVSKRVAVVDLVPTSGVPVDRADVTEAVDRELAGYGLRQKVSSRVRVRENGKVGA
ncbi:hypothetical protein ITJ64_17710 [Herbiconiux sp. VKM Ac-1786]|jgi:hypothetical protein|uniref:DUF6286 domain-containing protein n=1 Tax=Herbiconiux sp. VKM Ac-1786 TaxID=2783824 RepID=UPI00188DA592|nr:DUF6286 domain-containing protein [Herbiconiux sp. VKM Ac-1786]MBF4574351.1 hypothetical protein [Herbiconiux sp. VKM Ac-1786]